MKVTQGDIKTQKNATKKTLIKACASGMEDPHFCETYYIIAKHISESDFI